MKKRVVIGGLLAAMAVSVCACGDESSKVASKGESAVEVNAKGVDAAWESDNKDAVEGEVTQTYSEMKEYFADKEIYQISENPDISIDKAMDQIAINGTILEAPVTFEKLEAIGFKFFTYERVNDSNAFTLFDMSNKEQEVDLDESGIASFYACSGNSDSLYIVCDYRTAYTDICFPSKVKVGDLVITKLNYSGNNCSIGGGYRTGEPAELADVQDKYTEYRNRFLGYSEKQDERKFYEKATCRSADVFVLEGRSEDDPDIYMIGTDSTPYSKTGKAIMVGIYESDGVNKLGTVEWSLYDNLAITQMINEYAYDKSYRTDDVNFGFYRDLDLPVIGLQEFYDGVNSGKYSCSYDRIHRAVVVSENGQAVGKISLFEIPNTGENSRREYSLEDMKILTVALIFKDGKLSGRNYDLIIPEGPNREVLPVYGGSGAALASEGTAEESKENASEGVSLDNSLPVTSNLDEYGDGYYYLTSTSTPGLYEIYTDVVESDGDPRLVAYFETDETEICEMYMAEITKESYMSNGIVDPRWSWEKSNGLAKGAYDVDGEMRVVLVYQYK